MNISRFFGITNREAMRQVRLALGPDALIVSNRRVSGGVEILATDATSLSDAENAAAGMPETRPVTNSPNASAPLAAPTPPVSPRPQPAPMSPMSPMGAYAAAIQAAYGTPQDDAATQPTAESANRPAPAQTTNPSVPQTAASAPSMPSVPAPVTAVNPYYSADTIEQSQQPGVMDAIGEMRGALETRIDELLWGNQLRRAPQAASLFQTLMGFGFSTALLRAMLKRLPEQLSSRAALQWARQELVSHLPVLADEDALWQPGIALALVGPTGVGKTTTIAKLAARCVRRFGPDKLVLITTDTYRIGAHEQLKIYGQMLRVPVHVVRNANELRDIMVGIRPDQSILIDNVGISQRDLYVNEQAAMLAASGREITRLLVLNAASHGETLDEVARSYAADGGTPLRGCIVTKVDEATRLGAALDTALRYRLPIHYVSTGQKVPEHLVHLSASELVDRALTSLPSERSLYAPTEADLAALMSMSRQPETPDAAASAAQARQQQLQALPRLLSMAAAGGPGLTSQDLRAACGFVDEFSCAAEAYDLWKTQTTPDSERAPLESWVRRQLRAAQNEWSASGQKHLLAVHDQVALRAEGESPAQLRATLILNEQGAPLSSPMQQLSLTAGWLSSCGESHAVVPQPRAAFLHQINWLQDQASDLPLVHVFEGGNPALWRQLASRELRWIAQVPAITRVHLEDGATTAQALAKTLAHHPAADPDYLFSLSEIGGAPAADQALWVATASVGVAARGQQTLTLQLVSARLVDRASGKVMKSVLGLHPELGLSPDKVGAWLIVKAESRDAMRHAAGAWAALSASEGRSALQHKAMVAAQVGMAAWQLRKSPLAEESRQVAATMLGKKAVPSAAGAAAMLKLFALKEMMGA